MTAFVCRHGNPRLRWFTDGDRIRLREGGEERLLFGLLWAVGIQIRQISSGSFIIDVMQQKPSSAVDTSPGGGSCRSMQCEVFAMHFAHYFVTHLQVWQCEWCFCERLALRWGHSGHISIFQWYHCMWGLEEKDGGIFDSYMAFHGFQLPK